MHSLTLKPLLNLDDQNVEPSVGEGPSLRRRAHPRPADSPRMRLTLCAPAEAAGRSCDQSLEAGRDVAGQFTATTLRDLSLAPLPRR